MCGFPPASLASNALATPAPLWQNNYNMLSRADVELGTMPETCSRANADVSYLAYSPLAGGYVLADAVACFASAPRFLLGIFLV